MPRRPVFIRSLLIILPLGIIIGIFVALLIYIDNENKPEESVGRGQPLSSERLTDIRQKLQSLNDIPAERRQKALEAYLKGTLGAPSNADLATRTITLDNQDPATSWIIVTQPGETKRAGLVLWVGLPTSSPYTEEEIDELTIALNVLEDLARSPQLQREMITVFHPITNPLTQEPKELDLLQRQLELTRGGEIRELALFIVPPDTPPSLSTDGAQIQLTTPSSQPLLPAARLLRDWLGNQVL